jgi:itaconyl-CoA hydratase
MTWHLTSPDSYFEDFTVGSCIEHARGKTVGEIDNVLITNLVLNTAQAHFNEHRTGRRVVFGGITASMVIGLAMEDTGENAVAELGLDRVRFRAPVFHGDTLYAISEVLEVIPLERPDAGEVRFRHTGFNQDAAIVFEGERRVLIRRRGA